MPFVLGPLLVSLLPLLAALVLLGLSQASSAQHGSSNSGTFWDVITGRFWVHKVGGFAADFARWIVSHFAAGQLPHLARWFTGMGTLSARLFGIQAVFAEAVVEALQHIIHRGDPRARAKAQTANRHAIHAGHTATHANVHARSVGHALDRYKGRTNSRVHHLTHQTTVVLPRDIANVKHRERWAEKQLWKLRDRVIGLEDGAIKTFQWIIDHPVGAAAGVFTGALAAVLSWPGVRMLRCNELGNLERNFGCNAWSGLESLLGLLALGLAAGNLDTLVK